MDRIPPQPPPLNQGRIGRKAAAISRFLGTTSGVKNFREVRNYRPAATPTRSSRVAIELVEMAYRETPTHKVSRYRPSIRLRLLGPYSRRTGGGDGARRRERGTKGPPPSKRLYREMVLPVRIELTTSALPRMRSTTELRQHHHVRETGGLFRTGGLLSRRLRHMRTKA